MPRQSQPNRHRAVRRRSAKKTVESPANRQPAGANTARNDTHGRVHELRVHQVELAAQNEELRRIQQVLEAARDELADLFDHAPVGYFQLDQDGSIEKANLTLCEWIERPKMRVVGRPFSDCIAPECQDIWYFFVRCMLDRLRPEAVEIRLKRGTNGTMPVQIDGRLVGDARTDATCRITVTDISDRKRLEADLVHAQKMAALGDLAAGVAHEMNNFLQPIFTCGRIVRNVHPANSQEREIMELLLSSAERARDTVARILEFSRKEPSATATLDSHAGVKQALRLVRAAMPSSIDIAERLDPNAGRISIGAGELDIVLMNIASNACDAMGGSGRIEVFLESESVQRANSPEPGRGVRIALRDEGPGMDEATRKRVFDPFFTTKETGRGTGLGLASVYGIITARGGTVSIDSAPGKGTTVEVCLPSV